MSSFTCLKRPVLAGCALLSLSYAHAETASSSASPPPVLLENLEVKAGELKRFSGATPDVTPAGFAPGEARLHLLFPGSAYTAGISKGIATVGVMLDATGRPTDFLLIAYTQPYFGEALLQKVRDSSFVPVRARGVAVPSRFVVGYTFLPDPAVRVVMNPSEALMRKLEDFGGKPVFIHEPCDPGKLDRPLEFRHAALPTLPPGYPVKPGEIVRVPVSFYVDERGDLRLPNVDATPSPLLVNNAIEALKQWKFKPPTKGGKPALVFQRCVLRFSPAKS